MSKYKQLDFNKVKTYPIKNRKNKVSLSDFSSPVGKNPTMAQFLKSLPDILSAREFIQFLEKYHSAIKNHAPVIVMMGAHVAKVGLNPIIIDAIKHGWITHLALNGAGAIHDLEIALQGATSEDVGKNLVDGSFGMVQETAEIMNHAIASAKKDSGYGETIAKAIADGEFPYKTNSLLFQAYTCGIPVTVHSAMGTEVIHQHGSVDGAATGSLSYNDFRIFTHSVSKINEHSIVMNIGSAVILPEIFLKALTVVRNLGYNAFNFTSATFDMIRHYRPVVNVLERPVKPRGLGYYFIGHHELMLPLLYAALKS